MIPIYSLDTETTLATDAEPIPRLVCVSMSSTADPTPSVFHHSEAEPVVSDLLARAARREILLTGHNLCYFDLPVLLRAYPRLNGAIFRALNAGRIFDTLLVERLIERALGTIQSRAKDKGFFSLDRTAQRYGGKALDKGADGWRLRYGELIEIMPRDWPKRAYEYAANDAAATLDLTRAQLARIRTLRYNGTSLADMLKPLPGECRAAFALALIAAHGLACDRDQWRHYVRTNQARQAAVRKQLQADGILRARGSINEDRVRTLVGAELGAIAATTPKGKIKIDADALARCTHPALVALREYELASKALDTFAPLIERGTRERIHTRYTSIVSTARTSSGSPNLQNLPRGGGARECFAAALGTLLCSVDYSGAELRSFAQGPGYRIVGYSRMGDEFRKNVKADLHLLFGAARAGIEVDQALRIAGAKFKCEGGARLKSERQLAKIANFGFLGGMGGEKFAANENRAYRVSGGKEGSLISAADACALHDSWYKQWPEARDYHAWAAKLDRESDGQALVKEPISGGYRGGLWFSAIANTPFQSLTAWGAKTACWALVEACYADYSASPLHGAARPCSFIHDELLCEVDEKGAHELALEQTRVQIAAFQSVHPDVPVTAEPALMRRWCKGAEEKRDQQGRLIAWDAETAYAPPSDDPDLEPERTQLCLAL